MAKFEFDSSKLVINDVDLSGHMLKWVPLPSDVDYSQKIAGLKDYSYAITFDHSLTEEEIDEIAERYKSARADHRWSHVAQITPVKYETPDGKWQAFKARLKRRWPRLFRRLKVRYITFSFDAELESDGLFSLTGTAVGPMSKGTETR